MAAVDRDRNNQILPIAYFIVEAKTKDPWEWFIILLVDDLQNINQRPRAFIFDEQKDWSQLFKV
ncbi:unnamed protein product [Lathyrus oleraceus]